jgi:hypothetical protein
MEDDMKRLMIIAMICTVISGCATSRSGAERSTSAQAVAGSWSGTITGLEMASAADVVAVPARLEITGDGHWTLTSSGGAVASGVARPATRGIVLDGTMTAGDPMTVGRHVSLRLQPRGRDGMYGGADTFYLGHRVAGEIRLRRLAG